MSERLDRHPLDDCPNCGEPMALVLEVLGGPAVPGGGAFRSCTGCGERYARAGTEPRPEVHPLAVRVMADAGVDLSGQRPKSLAPFVGQRFDFVITVCDRARDACPTFPGDPEPIHWAFEDPAAAEGSEAERSAVFRRTRDAIQHRVRLFVNAQVRPRG